MNAKRSTAIRVPSPCMGQVNLLKPKLPNDLATGKWRSHAVAPLGSSAPVPKFRCPDHSKVIEYVCNEDNSFVCTSCVLIGKHKGHDCVGLKEGLYRLKHRLACVVDIAVDQKEKLKKQINRVKRGADSVREVCCERSAQKNATVAYCRIF